VAAGAATRRSPVIGGTGSYDGASGCLLIVYANRGDTIVVQLRE
jgi:hypothetical protein